MKAEDVFQDAICAAVEDMIPCQAVWWKDVKASNPPCFLWRIYETDFNEMLDGPEPETRYFEVESRAPTFGVDEFGSVLGKPWDKVSKIGILPHEGVKTARRNAERIVEYLQSKELLTHQMASFDERLDASMISARSLDDYFSHVIIVGMAAEVGEEIAREIKEEFDLHRARRILIPKDDEGYFIIRSPELVPDPDDPESGRRVVGNGDFTGARSQIQTVRVLSVQGQVVGPRSTVQVVRVLSIQGDELAGDTADIGVIRVLNVQRDDEFVGNLSEIMNRKVFVHLSIQAAGTLEGRRAVIEKAPEPITYGPIVLDIEG